MCSCGCSPCSCGTAGEIDPTECVDPGIIRNGAYATVLSEGLCPRRLAPFRGFKDNGAPVTDANAPLVPGVFVQDEEGNVKWTDRPKYTAPEKTIRVGTDAQAADTTNYIDTIDGKDADGNEKALVGTNDASSGNWRMVWVSSMQKWTTVPDTEPELGTDLCTVLLADAVLDPSNTSGFLLNVESTAHIAAGVSVKIQSYELAVTEVIDDHYIRVELVTDLTSPATIDEGASLCNIGFRPCPRTTEAYADTLVACLNNRPVSLEVPEDVNDIPVPGFFWRDQKGQIAFVPAPVNGTTGLIAPNQILATPASPVAGQSNLPGFIPYSTGYTWVTPAVAFTQSGSGPATGTFTFDVAGVTGYPSGAKVVILDVSLVAGTHSSFYTAFVKVNGFTAALMKLTSSFASGSDSGQILIPIESSTVLTMVISKTGSNGNSDWNLDINVVGFIG